MLEVVSRYSVILCLVILSLRRSAQLFLQNKTQMLSIENMNQAKMTDYAVSHQLKSLHIRGLMSLLSQSCMQLSSHTNLSSAPDHIAEQSFH